MLRVEWQPIDADLLAEALPATFLDGGLLAVATFTKRLQFTAPKTLQIAVMTLDVIDLGRRFDTTLREALAAQRFRLQVAARLSAPALLLIPITRPAIDRRRATPWSRPWSTHACSLRRLNHSQHNTNGIRAIVARGWPWRGGH
jgi:hypothetical protein